MGVDLGEESGRERDLGLEGTRVWLKRGKFAFIVQVYGLVYGRMSGRIPGLCFAPCALEWKGKQTAWHTAV